MLVPNLTICPIKGYQLRPYQRQWCQTSSQIRQYPYNALLLCSDFEEWMIYQIQRKLSIESYTPRTWRTHPLHICPSDPFSPTDPWNKPILNWIFLISALNFSFWSEKDGRPDRYGVEWQDGWNSQERKVWTGYWSLVAALNKGEDLFFSTPARCRSAPLITHLQLRRMMTSQSPTQTFTPRRHCVLTR